MQGWITRHAYLALADDQLSRPKFMFIWLKNTGSSLNDVGGAGAEAGGELIPRLVLLIPLDDPGLLLFRGLELERMVSLSFLLKLGLRSFLPTRSSSGEKMNESSIGERSITRGLDEDDDGEDEAFAEADVDTGAARLGDADVDVNEEDFVSGGTLFVRGCGSVGTAIAPPAIPSAPR